MIKVICGRLCQKSKQKGIFCSLDPFQNNFQELFNTICLVRPTFAALIDSTKFSRDFSRKRGRKSNGEKWKWTFMASSSGKVADDKEKHATEVKAQITPFVHIYKGSVLQDSLLGLRNSNVVLHPTPLHVRFHTRIQGMKDLFRYENLGALIRIHPSLLLKISKMHFLLIGSVPSLRYKGRWLRLGDSNRNVQKKIKPPLKSKVHQQQGLKGSELVLIHNKWYQSCVGNMCEFFSWSASVLKMASDLEAESGSSSQQFRQPLSDSMKVYVYFMKEKSKVFTKFKE
ncbi:hypothetical protein L3X38_041041 [Prunus dulcis]|uniref:Uncharacterized protein n=1 Tax=Prunus dulcis TaxID=3755 RepID=A0AAD4USH4_PRUDU|nr:hypothetical protein L3X38_041041 [Prunus dulcis]